LKQTLKPGDWVLIKGSRGMAMEDTVNALKIWAGITPTA
jgi:UDP-N-acetylmuramyl pentapeptide synthase